MKETHLWIKEPAGEAGGSWASLQELKLAAAFFAAHSAVLIPAVVGAILESPSRLLMPRGMTCWKPHTTCWGWLSLPDDRMITLPTSGPAAVKAGLLNQLRWGPYLPRECPRQLCLCHTRWVHAAHKGDTVGAPRFRGQGLHFWAPQNFSNIRPVLKDWDP